MPGCQWWSWSWSWSRSSRNFFFPSRLSKSSVHEMLCWCTETYVGRVAQRGYRLQWTPRLVPPSSMLEMGDIIGWQLPPQTNSPSLARPISPTLLLLHLLPVLRWSRPLRASFVQNGCQWIALWRSSPFSIAFILLCLTKKRVAMPLKLPCLLVTNLWSLTNHDGTFRPCPSFSRMKGLI